MSLRSRANRGGRLMEAMSRLWHGLVVLVILSALILMAVAGYGSRDTVGVGTGLIRLFSYFTIESNLLVLVIALSLVIRPHRDGRLWRVAHLDALLGIVITGLVFDVALAPQVHVTGAAMLATIGLHYVTPWAMLLGWLAFGPRPGIGWRTVGVAFAWPVLWMAYTFVHGAASHWYPYPFLDVTTLGLGPALANTSIVVAIAAALAAAFKLLDRLPDLRSWQPTLRPVAQDT